MIRVIGIGPGHVDYILPKSLKYIQKADMVIGAARNIEIIEEYCDEYMLYSNGLNTIGQYITNNINKEIAVVVSGDSCFYSLLKYIKSIIDEDYIEVIPGISSLQYMFSKLKLGYEEAKLTSCHGRECDIESMVTGNRCVGILTDKVNNINMIAKRIRQLDIKDIDIYIGERLSYEEENIVKLTIEEAIEYKSNVLSVVVVINNEY